MKRKPNIDAGIFKATLKEEEAPEFQKVVPVAKSSRNVKEDEAVIYFRVDGSLKKEIDIYIARAGRSVNLRDMGSKAFEEYMSNHPIEE